MLALMILWIVILHSYIRQIQKETSLDKLLEKYNHDETHGYLINKVTSKYYCTKCLYSEPHKEVPLTKCRDKWMCKMCDKCYFEYK